MNTPARVRAMSASFVLVCALTLVLTACAQPRVDETSSLRPEIVSAEAWGSTPEPFPPGYRHEPTTVLIHHAGVLWEPGTDPEQKLRNLQGWGQSDKGWADVPYHFLIAPDGRVFEGRSLAYRPDTNTDFDTFGYVNVQLWGNFNEQRVSAAQLDSAAALCAWLAGELDMSLDDLVTHRDVAPGQTDCPGDDFYRYFESGQFTEWVTAYQNAEKPHVELLPTHSEGPEVVVQP